MPKGKQNLKVKRSATGLGLFTPEPISAKQRIIEFTGPLITNEERMRIGGKYLFEVRKGYFIDGRSRNNIARYINHSCRPNAVAYTEGNKIWIWSRKKIKAGSEITINYGKEYLDQYIKPVGCRCEKCRSNPNKSVTK
ncbi:MAG TPA: SET domain-containing protein [Blastocatellia bacterium]|nr:SET domain-containing protein [Blastocatellia bacterium]